MDGGRVKELFWVGFCPGLFLSTWRVMIGQAALMKQMNMML
jgi:hypothetical protein